MNTTKSAYIAEIVRLLENADEEAARLTWIAARNLARNIPSKAEGGLTECAR